MSQNKVGLNVSEIVAKSLRFIADDVQVGESRCL
jgi:hypothetical protein